MLSGVIFVDDFKRLKIKIFNKSDYFKYLILNESKIEPTLK
jgi:hypothetical protein